MSLATPPPKQPAPIPSRPGRPVSQGDPEFRKNWPLWAKELPVVNFPTKNPNFQLIDPNRLQTILKDTDPKIASQIKDDVAFLERDLMRLFRDHDFEAKRQQNRYRLYQVSFTVLAALATLLGSLQALTLNNSTQLLPTFAFIETAVALIVTFLASVASREPALPLWMNNRRRAESLRREYFRFLMNMPPYDTMNPIDRRQLLARRAADENRGEFPDEPMQ